ncbi:MAG: hypothetical protein JXR48_09115 [Candidatus Delongbacteria bacterium]|nr:hypothetical protein [Candidatus Delongbacteria bacterium]MBN2835111.1 hypothetical protein [Candidatus Delongbacteria bacterium]
MKTMIEKYDFEGSIVLLEGKRDVLDNEKEKLINLGELLAKNSKHIIFRSGNAKGADYYFSLGVAKVDKSRLQTIIPYKGHRNEVNLSGKVICLDEFDLKDYPEIVEWSKENKGTKNLIEKFVNGSRDRFTIKAAYILRDTVKVLGIGDYKPATFGIFYDDLTDPEKGGTGHTMNMCRKNGIEIIDQKIWFGWLD